MFSIFFSEVLNLTNSVPQKVIRVIRHPIRTAISEFNRHHGGQYKSIGIADFNADTLKQLSDWVLSDSSEVTEQHKQLFNHNITTLYISYEDMTQNLLPQLFRIQHFLGFDTSYYIERTFCAYFRKRMDEKIKRVYQTDVMPKLLEALDITTVTKNIEKQDQFLRRNHLHFLRKREYLDLLKNTEPLF